MQDRTGLTVFLVRVVFVLFETRRFCKVARFVFPDLFTFQEACMYIGISESMLYKLTSGKEIPHYKPRGKMIYFAKEDLDEWLLQNYEPTVDEAARMANEAAATQPFFNQRRHGKRKKN